MRRSAGNCSVAVQSLVRHLRMESSTQLSRTACVWLILLASLLIATGCGDRSFSASTSDSKVFFPQLAPSWILSSEGSPSALLEGKLVLVNGCLRANETPGETSYLVVWPSNVVLDTKVNPIRILNKKTGQLVAQVGNQVRLGGGEVQLGAQIMKRLQYPLPGTCPGPYWLASEVLP